MRKREEEVRVMKIRNENHNENNWAPPIEGEAVYVQSDK